MVRFAKRLREVNGVLSPRPLATKDDLDAWYRGEERLQALRGEDAARMVAFGLDRDSSDPAFKAFVMGRPGVGKSTEMTRLSQMVAARYQPLRFSVRDELDPSRFTAFDVILLQCVLLAEETERVTGKPPEAAIVRELFDWYNEGEVTRAKEIEAAAEAAGGMDTKGAWWDKVLGAFVTIKGGIRYAQTRSETVTDYKLKRVQPLIDVANRLIRNCSKLLKDHNGKEWLILGEDADKPGMDQEKVKELFLVHGNSVFGELDVNLVFNLPLGLTYGSTAEKLPSLPRYTIYDVPVFEPNKYPNEATIAYVQEILDARLDPALFEGGQNRRLIIASGANLRDLFAMVREAAVEAGVRGADRIEAQDVDRILQKFRVEFQKKLGTTEFDSSIVTPEQRVERLVELYRMEDTGAAVHDEVLGALVNSGVVQEFNGRHWFGLQPLIVDVLARMERVKNPRGGTL
ncbi:MAG: hypothetical protein MH204_03375 [Fimbriimonadaceae bacterium]|nr:hypothetical protein [Fimbriimonadaceae bacterium]